MNSVPSNSASGGKAFLLCVTVLALILFILFFNAFLPGNVVFSNDGPLGGMMAAQNQVPEIFSGLWVDLNWLGFPFTSPAPSVSSLVRLITTPVVWAKIYPAFSLLFVGLSAWFCFWQFKFRPLACLLGGIAATLNSDFFGTSCWGVASQTIGFGFAYLALGALADTTSSNRWFRAALAGFAVGNTVIEAYDIGALLSMVIAAFVLFQSLTGEGRLGLRVASSVTRLIVVTTCALLIAVVSLATIITTQVQGVVGSSQDAETKAQRWAEATLASLPKKETLGILVPGLFGFRGDTPNGGAYWGTAGSDPSWDNYLDSNRKGPPPSGPLHGGMGSNYAGALVVLVIAFTVVQLFRGKESDFNSAQRKQVWFFLGVAVVAMLLMFGRFAPFYRIFYAIPFASIMRNPAKFLHVLEWSLMILFAYGMHSLTDRYIYKSATKRPFDRKWVLGSFAGLGVAVLAWFIYASTRQQIETELAELTQLMSGMRIDPTTAAEAARATISFSLGQVAWAVLFFGLSISLVALVVRGAFAGPRAKIAGFLLCALLAVDLGWQNRPWIIIWNWKEKYVEAADNPVVAFLRQNANEHRVSGLPRWLTGVFRVDQRIAGAEGMFQSVYVTEWMQHVFQFYDVQCLDVVQMPRRPVEYEAFEQSLQFDYSTNTLHNAVRKWQLTNTRYLLGAAPLVDLLNQGLDPEKRRFQARMLFELYQTRAGGPILTRTNTTGPFALIEFSGALPRAKLYADWQVTKPDAEKIKSFLGMMHERLPAFLTSAFGMVDTNALATLEQLASKSFDPTQTVLLAEPFPALPGTNQNPGEVKFVSYKPKHIVLEAKANAPSVLLLNDKFDPNWKVTVDGQPAKLLRANFIVRGVFLDKTGEHRVEFKYQPPLLGLYISLAAVAVALGLLGYVVIVKRKTEMESAITSPKERK